MNRRTWKPEEKMNIVLEGLKAETSIAELCRKHNISQTLFYRWKDDFLQAGLEGLGGMKKAPAKDQAAVQEQIDKNEQLIGKFTIRLSEVKKRSISKRCSMGLDFPMDTEGYGLYCADLGSW